MLPAFTRSKRRRLPRAATAGHHSGLLLLLAASENIYKAVEGCFCLRIMGGKVCLIHTNQDHDVQVLSTHGQD